MESGGDEPSSPLFFMTERIYTVSEVAREVKRVIEQFIAPVWIEGEVSNFSVSRIGHVYFALKDQQALINCVIWRNVADSIVFQITNGMRLVVFGSITTYTAQSQYQINIQQVRPAGIGNLYLAYEALKRKLEQEGLFAVERKRALNHFPQRIGLITSPTGAALFDFLQISRRRNPAVEILIYPAQVQGAGAADTMIKGLQVLNQYDDMDCIVLARGGGSIEDLWAFNEEKLVRAIVASRLPVVSAVGHEVDFTLADFAADLRAPTPSAAAEIIIPQQADIRTFLNEQVGKCQKLIENAFDQISVKLTTIAKRLELNRPLELVRQKVQRLDELEQRSTLAVKSIFTHTIHRITVINQTLNALNPRHVLRRGYAIVFRHPEGKLVKSITAVNQGAQVRVELHNGQFNAVVEEVTSQPKK